MLASAIIAVLPVSVIFWALVVRKMKGYQAGLLAGVAALVIAFSIRGNSIEQLHLHAQLALAFKSPQLIPFFTSRLQNSLEEVIISLNEMVSSADAEFGSPFKAISFHGTITPDEQNILRWEMIVDV